MNGCRVLLLGMAYKKNTGDAREAPGTIIARRPCRARGRGARRRSAPVDDPGSHVTLVEATADELEHRPTPWSLVTDHDFFDYGMIARHARFVLDTRNRMRGHTSNVSEPARR